MTTPNELTELIKLGEGQTLEFKKSEILSQNNDLAKLMVAFANTMGGKILVGVDDNGDIEGMKSKKGHDTHIVNIARDKCEPPICPLLEVVKTDAGEVYVITIPRFVQHPHAAKTNGKTHYIRVGTNVREASPQELAMLFSGGTAQPSRPTIINKEHKEDKKHKIRWEIYGPKSLPDPFDLRLERMRTMGPKYLESWMLDFPISFPIKFKMTNFGEEPINLLTNIWSPTRAIIFKLAEPKTKWVLKPYPHREKIEFSKDNTLRIEVPENGQSINFTFDAIYHPKFAMDPFIKRLVINYKFDGSAASGTKFVAGSGRIEIKLGDIQQKKTGNQDDQAQGNEQGNADASQGPGKGKNK
jgi:hypothetical protein